MCLLKAEKNPDAETILNQAQHEVQHDVGSVLVFLSSRTRFGIPVLDFAFMF